jgi:transporter family-2 protein
VAAVLIAVSGRLRTGTSLALGVLPLLLPHQPWLCLGGAIGVGFTAIGVAVVRRIGVLLLGLAVIVGQLTGALVLDLVVPGPAGRPGFTAALGAALTLLAVLVALTPVSRSRTAG